MQSQEFLDLLLPGDARRGAPCFSIVATQEFIQEKSGLLARLEQLLALWQQERNSNMLCPIDQSSVDDIVMYIKREDGEFYQTLREEVLSHYLMSPDVLKSIGEAVEPLYPRGQILPAFPFESLELVYERGPCWRSIHSTDRGEG